MKKVLSVLVVSVLMFSVQSFATLSVNFAVPAIINNTDDVMIYSQTFTTYGSIESIAEIKGDVVVSIQDQDPPPGDGATLGSYNSMAIFTAYIDNVPVATLLDNDYSLTAPQMLIAFDTDTFGWVPYSGSVVSKISVEVVLTVSPGDSATITGDFDVNPVPEPATMSLMVLGGLLLRKRK